MRRASGWGKGEMDEEIPVWIEEHPFVPGDANYGWENQCGFHVRFIGVGIGEEEGVTACCGYPREVHSQAIPRALYEAGLADRRNNEQ